MLNDLPPFLPFLRSFMFRYRTAYELDQGFLPPVDLPCERHRRVVFPSLCGLRLFTPLYRG